MKLASQAGLAVELAADGTVTVGLDLEDWFGPGRPSLPVSIDEPVTAPDELGVSTSVIVVDGDVRCSVRAYLDAPLVVFRCEATRDLSGLATGTFDQPAVEWPRFHPADRASARAPSKLRALVFQHTASLPFRATPARPSTAGFCCRIALRPAGPCSSVETMGAHSWWHP